MTAPLDAAAGAAASGTDATPAAFACVATTAATAATITTATPAADGDDVAAVNGRGGGTPPPFDGATPPPTVTAAVTSAATAADGGLYTAATPPELFAARHGRPLRPVDHPAFDPFRRDDPPFRASDLPVRFLCLLLLPVRLALAATCIVGVYLAHLLLGSRLPQSGSGSSSNSSGSGTASALPPPLPAWRAAALRAAGVLAARGVLAAFGFWPVLVDDNGSGGDTFPPPLFGPADAAAAAGATIVCSHASVVDVPVLMAADCPAFVAKVGVRSLPLIGRVAVGLGSLFVDRLAGGAGHVTAALGVRQRAAAAGWTTGADDDDDDKDRHSDGDAAAADGGVAVVSSDSCGGAGTTGVRRRRRRPAEDPGGGRGGCGTDSVAVAAAASAGARPPPQPLAIFPEGTTTNGRLLLRFRTGAFVAGLPVSPVVLSYGTPGGWSPTYESISAAAFVAGLLARPVHRVMVRRLPLYVPSAEERADARLYANNVRAVMAAAGGVGVSDSNFTDKLEYHVLTLGRSMPRNVRLRD